MANIVLSLLATFNGKALTKGKKEVSAFDKQVKRLGKTFAATFGAGALLRFSKKAIKAFAEDEAAAKSLELQLRNTGFAFSAPAIEQYIGNLQKLSGVLDDELRPAFQQLLTVTGSITKSQDALQTALNVSAATGRSLSEVSAALTRGFSGNTAGLSRLGAGISKATLKTGDMDKIMGELNKKFAGQAAARLTTYAGKMDLLKVASENVKEEIGRGILGALDALGKDTNIEDTTKKMEELGKQTGDSITGLGVFLKTLGDIPGIGMVGKAFYETSALGLLARLGRQNRPARELPASEQRSAGRISTQQFRVEIRQKKELDRLRALELAALKKKTAVDELKDKFDLERIGLTAALNVATDDETKLRLRSQLAILDNNEALAKKLLAELAAADSLKNLSDASNKASEALDKNMNKYDKMISDLVTQFMALGLTMNQSLALAASSARLQAQADAIASGRGSNAPLSSPSTTQAPRVVSPLEREFMDLGHTRQQAMSLAASSERLTAQAEAYFKQQQEIKLTIDMAQSGDKFAQLIAESLQVAGRSGFSSSPNGSLP